MTCKIKYDAEYRGVGAATAINNTYCLGKETTLYDKYFTKPTIKFTTNNVGDFV